MAVEWAWIRPQRPIELADRGIFLPANGACMVMLLHGLTGSPTELGYLAYHLQYRGGYPVRCPRLVNHGQPLGVLARTTWRQLYDSAREALSEARQDARERGVPLVVGGLSLGAVLSLILAAEFPDDVAGVACLSPTLFYDGWNVPWYHKLIPVVDYTPFKYFTYFREDEPYGLKDESLRAKIAAQYEKVSLREGGDPATLGYAHFPVRLFCEMRHLIARCKDLLPKVACPVLLIQAEHDDMTSPKNSQFILDRIDSSWRELILLKQSYHVVSADLERAAVAVHLQRFCGVVIGLRQPGPRPMRWWTLQPMREPVLFFDFDNTLTAGDVLDDVIERFSPNDAWREWEQAWADGRMSARECLQRQVENLRVTREALLFHLESVRIDDAFAGILRWARLRQVDVNIVSDSFLPLILHILHANGIGGVPVFANDLKFSGDRLHPSFPFYDPAFGRSANAKARHLAPYRDHTVIFAGDGRSDLDAALASHIVFAKGLLASELAARSVAFLPFETLAVVLAFLEKMEIPVHAGHRI